MYVISSDANQEDIIDFSAITTHSYFEVVDDQYLKLDGTFAVLWMKLILYSLKTTLSDLELISLVMIYLRENTKSSKMKKLQCM
ncbi:hypothetical protein ACEN33_07325 [Ruoffia sp. FAM 24228]